MGNETHSPPSLAELRTAWSARVSFNAGGAGRVAIGLLADGAPVTPGALAAATGMSIDEVTALIDMARAVGVEVEDGAIVGAALTLRPTQHQFRVRGHDMYTWCGFDALFLPMVLAERAHVASTCPVADTEIRLTVEADGTVSDRTPARVVVGIVGDDVISCCSGSGPASEICTQMPFFATRNAGERWLADHPGVAIVDLDDARGIASAHAKTF